MEDGLINNSNSNEEVSFVSKSTNKINVITASSGNVEANKEVNGLKSDFKNQSEQGNKQEKLGNKIPLKSTTNEFSNKNLIMINTDLNKEDEDISTNQTFNEIRTSNIVYPIRKPVAGVLDANGMHKQMDELRQKTSIAAAFANAARLKQLLDSAKDLRNKRDFSLQDSREAMEYKAFISAFSGVEALSEGNLHREDEKKKLKDFKTNLKELDSIVSGININVFSEEAIKADNNELEDPISGNDSVEFSGKKAEAIRDIDRWLLKKLGEVGNKSRDVMIYQLINSPMRERALVYQLLENDELDKVSETTFLTSQSDYAPDIEKVKDNLRRAGIKRLFNKMTGGGHSNIRMENLTAAIQLAKRSRKDIADFQNLIKSSKQAEEGPSNNENGENNNIDINSLTDQRNAELGNFAKKVAEYSAGLQKLQKKGKKKTAGLLGIETELRDSISKLKNINEQIADYAQPIKKGSEKLSKGQEVDSILSTVTTGFKQGASIADTGVGLFTEKIDLLSQIGANLGLVSAGLSFINACMSTFSYLSGVSKTNWYTTITEPITITGQATGTAGTLISSANTIWGVSSSLLGGTLSTAAGFVTLGVGIANLYEADYRKEKGRLAYQKWKALNQEKKQSREGTLSRQMINLQQRISDAKEKSAARQCISGSLTALSGGLALAGAVFAPFAVAGLAFGAIGFIAGIVNKKKDKKDKAQVMKDTIDEYLGIDAMEKTSTYAKWLKESGQGNTAAARSEYRKNIIQSMGYDSEKAYFGHIMEEYARALQKGLYNSENKNEQKMYMDLAKSLRIYVNLKNNKPDLSTIYSKLMKL